MSYEKVRINHHEIEDLFMQFEVKWNTSILKLANNLAIHYGINPQEDLTEQNVGLFLERVTSSHLINSAKNVDLFVLSASPSTGKSIVGKHLMEAGLPKLPRYTTRPPRPGEGHGLDYYFVDLNTFMQMLRKGEFAHSKPTHSGFRAISFFDLRSRLQDKMPFFIEGDALAVAHIKDRIPEFHNMKYLSVYLLPINSSRIIDQIRNSAAKFFPRQELEIRLRNSIEYLRKSEEHIKNGVYHGYLVNHNPFTTADAILHLLTENTPKR